MLLNEASFSPLHYLFCFVCLFLKSLLIEKLLIYNASFCIKTKLNYRKVIVECCYIYINLHCLKVFRLKYKGAGMRIFECSIELRYQN